MMLQHIFPNEHQCSESLVFITKGKSSGFHCCFAFKNVFEWQFALEEIGIQEAIWEH
jgi:hypothetical protein